MEAQRSIIKTYRQELWSKFTKAVRDYELIDRDDHIMVCISGGKDSFLMAMCIKELAMHGRVPFTAEYVVMNPGYSKETMDLIKANAQKLEIPLKIFDSPIFDIIKKEDKPCYLCARMRRGFLYNEAQTLGCNKIALGHHFNDVIETGLLSMMYAGEIKTMLPMLHSTNFKGISLIRPLYLIDEEDIINWKKHNALEFINCACPLFNDCSLLTNVSSKRQVVKNIVKELNAETKQNIFKAYANVDLHNILGYRENKEYHSFLDEYKKEK